MALGLLSSPERAPQISITEIAKWPLHFVFSYVQPITNTRRRTSAVNQTQLKIHTIPQSCQT